jgi:hypothetical protein
MQFGFNTPGKWINHNVKWLSREIQQIVPYLHVTVPTMLGRRDILFVLPDVIQRRVEVYLV